jgi:hypothetical protein
MAAAERAAGQFAERWGLDVGEVMEFSNGYYVELVTDDGSRATEVLVDPSSGAVQIDRRRRSQPGGGRGDRRRLAA